MDERKYQKIKKGGGAETHSTRFNVIQIYQQVQYNVTLDIIQGGFHKWELIKDTFG